VAVLKTKNKKGMLHKKKIEENKFGFKCFVKLNNIANIIYEGVQGGGLPNNLYARNEDFLSGIVWWQKEAISYKLAIDVYEEMTANETSDILSDLEDEVGLSILLALTIEDIKHIESVLEELV
jgi:hypothetical protein